MNNNSLSGGVCDQLRITASLNEAAWLAAVGDTILFGFQLFDTTHMVYALNFVVLLALSKTYRGYVRKTIGRIVSIVSRQSSATVVPLSG